jgi:hypothetical protein
LVSRFRELYLFGDLGRIGRFQRNKAEELNSEPRQG